MLRQGGGRSVDGNVCNGGGRFSFCNVYQPHDPVRHIAYSLYLSARLQGFGLCCTFKVIECNVTDADYTLQKANPYWLHQTYLVPCCHWRDGHPERISCNLAAQDSSSCSEHDDSGGGKRGAVVQAAVCCREHDPPPRKPADGRPRNFLLWNAQVRDGHGLGPGCARVPQLRFSLSCREAGCSLVVADSACTALLTWLLLLVPSCATPRSTACYPRLCLC